MARMATVKVLRRHSNDYDGVMAKVPEGDVREGETALTTYRMPLEVALRHERELLVEITQTDPDPEAEPEPKVIRRQSAGQVAEALDLSDEKPTAKKPVKPKPE